MLSRLLKDDLQEIARMEKLSGKGTKDELIKRLSRKVRIKKVRRYYSAFSMKRRKGKLSILEHDLVPKHRIMSEKEIKKLRGKYGIKNRYQLPKILMRDPVMIALGAVKGDVIEITRKSDIAGESKYYRLVI